MHKRTMIGIVLLSGIFMVQARLVLAQDERLQKIEQRLNVLEDRVASGNKWFDLIESYIPVAFPILGIGLFCGFWARNSGRDFWLWFAAGLVFTIFTLIAVLDAYEKDKKSKRHSAKLASKQTLDI
jgi:hypothetical protein